MNFTALQNKSIAFRDNAAPVKTAFKLGSGSTVYYGVKQETKTDIKYGDYGNIPGVSFTLSVEIADFTALPADNTEITIATVVYQIVAVTKDPAGIKAFFHVGDITA